MLPDRLRSLRVYVLLVLAIWASAAVVAKRRFTQRGAVSSEQKSVEPCREFIITGTKVGAKPATTDVKEEPAANGTKAAANGKAGVLAICGSSIPAHSAMLPPVCQWVRHARFPPT